VIGFCISLRDEWMGKRVGWILGVLTVLTSLAGCGSDLATVGGIVTLDGKPVEGGPETYGTVTFARESGGPPAVGIIKAGGAYVVATGSQAGMEPGTYLVGIAIKKVHPPTQPGGLSRPELVSPTKLASLKDSGLKREVLPGRNEFDFDLTSTGTR
jgi:hypothetical protein